VSGQSAPGGRTVGGFGGHDRPLGRDDVETALLDGEFLVSHESTRTVHRLNSTTGAVWSLCDGETTVEAMAHELGEIFAMEPADLTDDILRALDQIAAAGLLVGIDAASPQSDVDPNEIRTPDGSRMLIAPPDP
jgi:hypothetical protein